MRYGKYKVISSGHILEIYCQEYSNEPKRPDLIKIKKERSISDKIDNKRRLNNIMRTRNNIRRIALANFSNSNCHFITLTFDPKRYDFVKDIKACNYEFMNFIKRYNRFIHDKVKYIAVVEFQKNGNVHYHCIFDKRPYLYKDIYDLWGHGSIKVKDVTKVDNIGAYLIKYMSKDLFDSRYFGKKIFLRSRGLILPEVIEGEKASNIIENIEKEKFLVYESQYSSEYTGKVIYKEYNFLRKKNTARINPAVLYEKV